MVHSVEAVDREPEIDWVAVPPESPRIAELRRRVEADPTSIAFAQLAEEYRRAGNYEAAEQTCRTGLARHPGYLSARVTLGRTLIERGDLAGAEAELQFVLKGASDNLAAIRGIAEIFQRRGDLVQALEFYRRALPLARQDPELEETVRRIDRDLHSVRAAAPIVGLSFEEAQSELLEALARMPEVPPPTPALTATPAAAAASAAPRPPQLPAPEAHAAPASEPVSTPISGPALASTATTAPDPIIVRPENFPALVAPAAPPASPDVSLLEQPDADPHGIDFESLLQSLGAPDHPTPPTIEALLTPSMTHAAAEPILPELPMAITTQDPFASLEDALRQPPPSPGQDPVEEPSSAYDPFAGFDQAPPPEQGVTSDGERPALSDDPFARFPEPDAESRAHDPSASLDEATPAALTADPFARFDDPPSVAPDRFASFGETRPLSLAPDRFASFGETPPRSPEPASNDAEPAPPSAGPFAAFTEPDMAMPPQREATTSELDPVVAVAEPVSVFAEHHAATDHSPLATKPAVAETAVATMHEPQPEQNVLDELEAWLAAIKR